MKRFLVVFTIILFAGRAFAGEAEIKAAQQSIEAQLRAFQAGDRVAAYSYAAPNITRMFPTADIFMNMVETGYAPIGQPQSYSFGTVTEPAPGSIIQEMTIVGKDGRVFEANYTLELQPDGAFRITGVRLREAISA